MRKMIYALAAVAVMVAAAPAQADAKAEDGRVGLSVRGKGLRVDSVGAHMEGHGTGVQARVVSYSPRGVRSVVTDWKDATPVSAAMTKLSTVGWSWKGGKRFADRTRLCVEFNAVSGQPCVVIHR
ncbi:hypothetical protein [Streptomyces sp. NPDC049949]|uniref:hypothetical protein n=1 Tax=Streptomyces sp. NPDC049949 TaxID=3154627 RepID=UPI00344734DF